MSPFLVPLGVFAMVALLVAITQIGGIRDLEITVHHRLHAQEMEHQRRMRDLDMEIERIRRQI